MRPPEIRALEREVVRLHREHEAPERVEFVDEWHASRVGTMRAVLRIGGRLERLLAEQKAAARRRRKRRKKAA